MDKLGLPDPAALPSTGGNPAACAPLGGAASLCEASSLSLLNTPSAPGQRDGVEVRDDAADSEENLF